MIVTVTVDHSTIHYHDCTNKIQRDLPISAPCYKLQSFAFLMLQNTVLVLWKLIV